MEVNCRTKYRWIIELNGLFFQSDVPTDQNGEKILKFSGNLSDAFKFQSILDAHDKLKELRKREKVGLRMLRMDILNYSVTDAMAEAKAPPERYWYSSDEE